MFEDHNTKVLLTASSKTMNNTDKDSKINVLVSKRLLEIALTDDS